MAKKIKKQIKRNSTKNKNVYADQFTKVHAVKPVARKIKTIAAAEGRFVYEVVADMLDIYKAFKANKIKST